MSALLEMPAPQRCEMSVLNATGDTKLIWDPNVPDEVENARETFNRLRKKGHIAYRVQGTDKGEVMTEFDPTARKMILAPALVGG